MTTESAMTSGKATPRRSPAITGSANTATSVAPLVSFATCTAWS